MPKALEQFPIARRAVQEQTVSRTGAGTSNGTEGARDYL